jgi:exopolysaccharide biosynthesis polyprenyl glycosylphosphotransferase
MTISDGNPSAARALPAPVRAAHRHLVAAPAARGRRGYVMRRLLLAGDAAAIAGAMVGAMALAWPKAGFVDAAWGLVLLPVWAFLFKVYGLYDDGHRISHPTVDDVPKVFHALLVGSLALWAFYRVTPLPGLILVAGLTFFFLALVAVLVVRSAVREVARVTTAPERALMVGDGPVARALVRKLEGHTEYRVQPVGYLEAEGPRAAGLRGELPRMGTVDQLEDVCEAQGIDRVILLPTLDPQVLIDLIRRTRGLQVRLSLVPNGMEVLGPAVEIDDVEGITVLGVNPPVLTRSSRMLKRTMDVAVASAALAAALPFMALVALAVRLDSPGGALFAQERVGRDGRHFRLFKFRTMGLDAEARSEELRALSADPGWLLLEHDPRITRVGAFLRRMSIDELPQLWNVIRGDMSLVGPRPLTPVDHANVAEWGRRRLDLTPGLTGLWQVLGRTRIPFDEMVKLDYLYVTNWSLWGDVRLLIRTLPVVVRRRGAN